MSAWNIGQWDLNNAHDTTGMFLNRRIDAPSGIKDSTAIGDWRIAQDTYVIDLGLDDEGNLLGQRMVRFASVSMTSFVFETTALDGTEFHTVTIPKDAQRTWTSYRFASGVVAIEPPRATWDFCITQYTHQFYEPVIAYLVNGALIDGTTTRVAQIDGRAFATVSLSDTITFPFSNERNAIGYDWKVYSFETSSYTIVPDRSYIVQDGEGWFHKVRFTDFYGSNGESGCPTFEVVHL